MDWREVARLVLTSREMDRLEEEELAPAKKVLYQFLLFSSSISISAMMS